MQAKQYLVLRQGAVFQPLKVPVGAVPVKSLKKDPNIQTNKNIQKFFQKRSQHF